MECISIREISYYALFYLKSLFYTKAYPFAYRILFSLYYFLFRVSDLGRHFMNKIFPFLYGMVFTVLPFSYGSVSSGLPPRSSYHSFLILNSFCIYDFPMQKVFLRRSHLPDYMIPFIYRILFFIIAFLYRRLLSTTFLHNKSVFSIIYFLYRSFFACVFFIL